MKNLSTFGKFVSIFVSIFALAGCMTTGYTYVKDPTIHRAFPATIVSIEDQNIYNATGVAWVGPLAKVESVGWRLQVVLQTGQKLEFVQPRSADYALTAGEAVNVIENRGQIYAQPATLPLPNGVK